MGRRSFLHSVSQDGDLRRNTCAIGCHVDLAMWPSQAAALTLASLLHKVHWNLDRKASNRLCHSKW